MIASDITITELNDAYNMITPFIPELVSTDENGQRIPSFGLSSYGYDVRLQPTFKLFNKPNDGRIIDIMDFKEEDMVEEIHEDYVVIPPGGLVLGVTVETFNMPPHVTGICTGKSTWARIGTQVLNTPLEAGWSGELVVEITNGTNLPMKIYAGVGIAQIQFHLGDRECRTPYKARGGKYQNQKGVTTAKL